VKDYFRASGGRRLSGRLGMPRIGCYWRDQSLHLYLGLGRSSDERIVFEGSKWSSEVEGFSQSWGDVSWGMLWNGSMS